MRATSLRMLTAIAAQKGFRMRRWDFVAAYLQRDLEPDDVTYCRGPPGKEHKILDDKGVPNIYRVCKPVYGIAQAGRRWQRSLFPFLKASGFTHFDSDPCVFSKTEVINGVLETVLIGVYVDDLCIVYLHEGDTSLYHNFSTQLTDRWDVEDEGAIVDLLNIEFDMNVPGQITLHQRGYIRTLVERYGTTAYAALSHRTTRTPADENLPQLVVDALSARMFDASQFLADKIGHEFCTAPRTPART